MMAFVGTCGKEKWLLWLVKDLVHEKNFRRFHMKKESDLVISKKRIRRGYKEESTTHFLSRKHWKYF